MAYATIDDVRIFAPDVTEDDEEVEKVEYLLEQAEDLLGIEFPDLAARVADGRTPLRRVVQVEAEMVAAVMNNPRARQSEAETLGGLSRSFTVDTKVATGLLRVSPDQRRLLSGVGSSGNGAGSVAPLIGWTNETRPSYPDFPRPLPWPGDRW